MITLDRIRRYVDQKLLTVRARDDLIIVNYTHRCQYRAAWDEVTMKCRGLILRVDKPWPESTKIVETVALPFPKFFNVGEGDRVPGPIKYVQEKLDGWLGISYYHKGELWVATRGSFEGPVPEWATQYLRQQSPMLTKLHPHFTFLFEIIHPLTRIVVDYKGEEKLVLLGIRDCYSGQDFSIPTVLGTAKALHLSTPAIYDLKGLEEIIRSARDLDANHEGFVLHDENGLRWKVKGKTYREIHKIVSTLSPRRVLEALAEGPDVVDNFLSKVPDEWRSTVMQWHDSYQHQALQILNEIYDAYIEVEPDWDQKTFALWATSKYRSLSPFLFAGRQEKNLMPLIYKTILKNNRQAIVEWENQQKPDQMTKAGEI